MGNRFPILGAGAWSREAAAVDDVRRRLDRRSRRGQPWLGAGVVQHGGCFARFGFIIPQEEVAAVWLCVLACVDCRFKVFLSAT